MSTELTPFSVEDASGQIRLEGTAELPDGNVGQVLTVTGAGVAGFATPSGGFPIGSSVFTAELDTADGSAPYATGTPANALWKSVVVVGADLAINADSRQINVLTTGLYDLFANIGVFANAAADDAIANLIQTAPSGNNFASALLVIDAPGGQSAQPLLYVPAVPLASGASIAVQAVVSAAIATTWAWYNTTGLAVRVVRVA